MHIYIYYIINRFGVNENSNLNFKKIFGEKGIDNVN